jgi:cyclase
MKITLPVRFLTAMTLLLLPFTLEAGREPQAPSHATGSPFRAEFKKVADGVYLALSNGIGGNSVVVINDRDVLLVDSRANPVEARVLVAGIKSLTDKPIRFVVNTHYHFDHTQGNQIFGPDVLIIGSEFTRHQLLSNPLQQRTVRTSPNQGMIAQTIENLKKQLAIETDPKKKSALQQQVVVMQATQAAVPEVVVTPSNVTVHEKLVLFRGGREIQILFLGRGHTGGDLVVYLPKERIVCTGDLMEDKPSYMGDSYPQDWVATLDKLKALDFETVLPGHGMPFTGRDKITAFQGYVRDVWKQSAELKKQGVSLDDATKRVDLTAYAKEFPTIQGPGLDKRQLTRMYLLLDGKDEY